MKISRHWLQTYFDTELPSADEIAAVLTSHAFEVEGVEQVGDDYVIDVDVLANRSSDCLSHRGIARELSTLLARPLKEDPFRTAFPLWPNALHLEVEVEDDTLCPRYMGALVRGVTVGSSPDWLKKRLETLGQRSINNIVDATNFVMFNLGQPLHAFDYAKLAQDEDGMRKITVRSAHEGEQITTLTGDERTLSDRHLLITDGISDDPLAIAGIKGGKQAEIDIETTDIVLEAAHFDYSSVRKTSRELRLATDASVRFQNEPPRELPAFALRDVIELIKDIAGGELIGVRDVYVGPRERQPINVSLTEINNLLGTTLTYDDVERILIRFEWEFSRGGDTFAVTSPWERTDLTYKEAFIEEIGRVYGYANIKGVLPLVPDKPAEVNHIFAYTEKLRHLLTELGYSEVMTYTLRDRGVVELMNPLASDKSLLRMSLRDGIVGALDQNAQQAALLGVDDIKIFELGTVWNQKGEDLALALGVRAVRGKQSKLDKALGLDMQAVLDVLAPGRSDVQVTTEDGVSEVILDQLLPLLPRAESYDPPLTWNTDARFNTWSRYPYIVRDIAVWAPSNVPFEVVQATMLEKTTNLLVRWDGFDVFRKDDRTSYAWHLVFQSREKTLTDEEVGKVMEEVTATLNAKEGWEVR